MSEELKKKAFSKLVATCLIYDVFKKSESMLKDTGHSEEEIKEFLKDVLSKKLVSIKKVYDV